jgi:hypothetical protein
MHQLCRYESLLDCTLDLADIATLNEALDVQEENARRMREFYDRRQY